MGVCVNGAMSDMPVTLAARCARAISKKSAQRSRRAPEKGAGATLRRARGMPGAQCTHSLVCAWCSEYAHEYSQRGHRDRPAFPHAMVLTVYFVLSPAIGCFATVASRIKVLPARLSRTNLRKT